MRVITAKGTGICMEHDDMMFLASFEPRDGIVGCYVNNCGNIQSVKAQSVYGEQMIATIIKWEEETV